MWAQIIGAVAGGIAGAAYSGYTSYTNANKNAKAYRDYATRVSDAAEKYSGKNADSSMNANAEEYARLQNNSSQNAAANMQSNNNNLMANALNKQNNVRNNNAYQEGLSTGRNTKQAELNAKYNADTALAQQAMNQANIDYKTNTAMNQAGLNTAAGAIDAYNSIKSDENSKEDLTQADVEDSLRKIESIEYKYKPEVQEELGLDDEEHVGVKAQDVQKTPLDDKLDIVETGPDGYLQLDKQMMLEAVLAGIAAVQKEIDGLKQKRTRTYE